MKCKAKPMSRDDITKLVKTIRDKIGIDELDYIDIVRLVELELPKILPGFVLEVVPEDEMPNVFARTYPNSKRMVVREDIYELAVIGDGFARLTLSHETGHLFMQKEDSISFCRHERCLKPYEDPEWQANAFGGELLAPSYRIMNKTIEQIKKDHGVTKTAAMVQRKAAKKRMLKEGSGSK